MKVLRAEYIESGTFIAGGEDTYHFGAERGKEYVVLHEEEFDKLQEDAMKYRDLCD